MPIFDPLNDEVEELLFQFDGLKRDRAVFEQHWQRLAELMLPRRADFTTERPAGERRLDQQYDSVPMLAARGLSAAIDGLLKPRTSRWFFLQAADPELNEVDEVKRWLEAVQKRMQKAIYDRRARFVHASNETDNDLVVFGTANIFTGESTNKQHLIFRNYHLKNTYVVRNAAGAVEELFLRFPMNARQAEAEFGAERLGDTAKRNIQSKKLTDKIDYLQVIRPRSVFDPRRLDARNMPFQSIWIEVPSKHKVTEGGFREFPSSIPVWDSSSGEDYGRSPGMLALPDSNTVNAMGRTILKAGQKAVDPPLLIGNDSILSNPRLLPGSATYFDMEAARALGRIPVEPLNLGANFPIGIEMQRDTRDQIWQAFFRNVLQLPVEGPEMTATEVLERKDEFIRTVGPVFGRLESDYTAPVVERVFAIMFRNGAFPPPPRALRGRDTQFEFVSPVERVRKQIEAAGMARAIEVLAPFVQADPNIMDNYDGDVIARDISDAYGMPITWLRTPEVRDALRQARAEQQEQREALAAAESLASTAQLASQAEATSRAGTTNPQGLQ